MLLVLAAVTGACVFALVVSLIFNWASSKSALWSMAIGAVIVFAGTGAAAVGIVVLIRRLSD